ncbi:hypothetical protein N9H09_01665, partial [bacterium]|nr:hypothetical protein [bacterium]
VGKTPPSDGRAKVLPVVTHFLVSKYLAEFLRHSSGSLTYLCELLHNVGSINEVGLTIDVNKTNIAGGFISRGIINGPPNPGLRSLPTKSKFLATERFRWGGKFAEGRLSS